MALPEQASKSDIGYKPGPYKYPLDEENKLVTKISFQAIRVEPPQFSVSYQAAPTYDGGDDEFGNLPPPDPTPTGVTSTGLKIRSIEGEKADIHVPISFQVNDGLNYSNAELGAFGGAITNVLNKGGSISDAAFSGLKETGQSMLSLLKVFNGSEQELGRLGLARLARSLPVGSQAVQVGARVSVNPNVRTAFQSVNIREFNFNFKFLPTSQAEAQTVQAIIHFFRYHAYPELIGDPNFSVGYEYPDMFKIRLLYTGGRNIVNIGTPIQLCYLKGISTTYNPTSTVVFPDGQPTEIDMNLNFAEYRALSRDDLDRQSLPSYYSFEGVGEEVEQETDE